MKKQYQISLLLCSIIMFQVNAQPLNFEFIENKGQWNSRVKFRGDIGVGSFFLEKKGFTVLLNSKEDLKRLHEISHGSSSGLVHIVKDGSSAAENDNNNMPAGNNPMQLRAHAYRMSFEGASDQVEIVPEKPQSFYYNYLIGDDPSQWASGCNIYRNIAYKNMYPGIDLRYYSENGKLKYDIVVNPGANPENIVMKYEGADRLWIKNRQLYVKTSVGEVSELEPYSYQFDREKGKTAINCRYEITNNNTVRFKIKAYAKNLPLIIDPTLIFSSFSGSRTDNWGFTATPGPDGSLFGAGIVQENGYPVTPGAVQNTSGGGVWDIGLTRFSPDGSSRIYSTFMGGNGNDYPLSMIADANANLVMMGRTYSPNFLKKSVGNGGNGDLFVAKLNANGTAYIGGMRIGGSGLDAANIQDQRGNNNSPPQRMKTLRFYGDDSRGEVILDKANNIYVITQTQSSDFPMVNPFQDKLAGAQDGAVLKLNPDCNNIIFSSYLGGSNDDGAFVMDISPLTGNLYVAGTTASTDFPGNTSGTVQPAPKGGYTDGFISELANDGSGIIRTTYLGTNSYDAIYGLKFDKLGYPYVMGITESGSWPVLNAAYSNPQSKQFIVKLKPDLSEMVYSTVFGSGSSMPNISPVAFLVDRCENVYVSGWGGYPFASPSTDVFGQSGVNGMPITPGALKSITDNKDFYFLVLKKNAASLLYASFFGQGGAGPSGFGEHVDGGTSRYDQQGVIYQAICANCEGNSFGQPNPAYPITPGVVGPVNGAGDRGCNLGVVKIAFNFAGVGAGIRAYIRSVADTSGCVPMTVVFKDTVRNAASYEWNFGDGTPTVATKDFSVSHTYTAVGTYRVMLVGVDSTTCNMRDTVYMNVKASDNQAFIRFSARKLQPCQSLSYQFNNNSTLSPTARPFTDKSFVWDFGDGTRVTAGMGNITHSYAAAGTYKVRLILPDTGYCNSPDSTEIILRVAPLVKAQVQTPPFGCAPYHAVFNNTSLAGQDFFWDFGDGTTASDNSIAVTHLYATPGNYTIKMVATDTSTCNKTDSVQLRISVYTKPAASFTYAPLTPQQNYPYTFTNTSSADATHFKWLFGDGDSLLTASRADLDHLYNTTGTYRVLLVAFNAAGCTDTARAQVVAVVVPRLDIPNAFTPQSNSLNSVIYIRGFGIGRMRWRIYSRVGNLVFESNSPRIGWDGKYKGVLQPMDVYAYTLEVEFTDGTKTTRKGDITLLR